ncbi:MAG: hydrogen gas-evolving membrane-bound hydrogenase subunit E [Halovenus sp.]
MEPELSVLVLAIALPFLGAVLAPLVGRLVGDRVGYFGAVLAATSFGLVLTQAGTEGTVAAPWIPSLDVAVRLHVDGLALLFALLASGIGVLIFAYANRYMRGKPDLGKFYMALLAFMGSILGVAFAADLVVLFLFWELTSVCSFVLIGYHTEDAESQYSARMAMVITVGGGLCLLVGILLLAFAAGTAGQGAFDLAGVLENADEVRTVLEERGLFLPALGLVTVAAAAKSAQVPLYFWLPGAMVAPTPVSAFLHSATMVKVGVYALGRVRPLFHGAEWMGLVATLGMVTMAVGALLAVLARDIKELLAYSTASHLGLMVAAFGFQSHYGAEAGVFHLLNHALFKAALFLVAGIVAHEAGTRHIEELGGLWRDLPVTAGITGLATLSMAGIPPFNGFYSKEILFEAAWETAQGSGGVAWLYPATAVAASIFTVLYSLRFLWLFLGDRPDGLGSVHRAPAPLVVPPAVLAGAVAIVSIRPALAIDFVVEDGARAAAVDAVDIHAGLPRHVTGPVVMSAVAIVGGVAAFPFYAGIRRRLERIRAATTRVHPTAVYAGVLMATERASAAVGTHVHNGLIRTYVWWTLLSACVLTGAGYATATLGVPTPAIAGTPAAMTLVLSVAVVAAFAVTVAESHVTGVLTLGILGFMVAIFYILASGADLALTQLVVETLLLLVFLLVLEELPAFYGELAWRRALRDATLSVVVGATAFVSVLYATPGEGAGPTPTAEFYVENAVPEGGGANVVNVILTDFRAFDTLGESIVILTAALSVLVLLTMRDRGETQ